MIAPSDAMRVSVIVPTHNRKASLRRTLAALEAQSYPRDRVEIIVVADGCEDGTAEMLRREVTPLALRVCEQPGAGAAAARNHGAAQATGELLIFLDDDVEPIQTLLEAHVQAHATCLDSVVIGPAVPVTAGTRADFFRITLHQWWQAQFDAMRRQGHRFTYRDLTSGNFSLRASLFARAGRFDSALRCREDYELGARLIKRGAVFTFAPEAVVLHHDVTGLDRSLARARQEGRGDVLIARRHPELVPMLAFAKSGASRARLGRGLVRLAVTCPTVGDRVAVALRRTLAGLEAVRARRRWRKGYGLLRSYWYWRGVAEEASRRQELAELLARGRASAAVREVAVQIDLSGGVEAAARRLDAKRPASAIIRLGPQLVGHLPWQPGAERLRGAHLLPALAGELAAAYIKALAIESLVGPLTPAAHLPVPTRHGDPGRARRALALAPLER